MQEGDRRPALGQNNVAVTERPRILRENTRGDLKIVNGDLLEGDVSSSVRESVPNYSRAAAGGCGKEQARKFREQAKGNAVNIRLLFFLVND